MSQDYHPEYSSSCMKLGCSFCNINKNVAERIARFVNIDECKTGRLTQKQIERRQLITLGYVCKPKLHTNDNNPGVHK